ncbi:hypothetical protein [Romeriopsis navalis]|uniref:hypothetical protein n=1 Tax=Romeriopsis navalis TaxID=2992132 RepID=UPI003F910941
MQLTDNHSVATPANWQDGGDCVVMPSINTEDAKVNFPKGIQEVKPYLRMPPNPMSKFADTLAYWLEAKYT